MFASRCSIRPEGFVLRLDDRTLYMLGLCAMQPCSPDTVSRSEDIADMLEQGNAVLD